jgi:hypothetical protein
MVPVYKKMSQLSEQSYKVIAHYTAYENNPDNVLVHHSNLFTHQPLNQCLQYSHDNITCWLWSIDEARAILSLQLWETSRSVFNLFVYNTTTSSGDLLSTDSSYSPSFQSSSEATASTVSNIFFRFGHRSKYLHRLAQRVYHTGHVIPR